jgi:predicted porin
LARYESEIQKLRRFFKMQKKLIALAVVAAFSAPAFADTSLYGTVDAVVANVSADGQKSDLLAASGGLSPSRFGVKSVEDLNNGMKAVVVLEYGLDPQTNTTIGVASPTASVGARQQMLALAGGFGTVATGYLQTTGYDWAVKFDPTAESLVSPLQSMNQNDHLVGATAIAARAPRALAYISPNMSGVTVAVNYTTSFDNPLGNLTLPSGANTGLKTTAYLVGVNYDWNALSVGGVYAATNNQSTGIAKLSEYALGASYDFTVVKLFGTYQSIKSDAAGASANKAMSVSVVAPVGPGAIAASYARSTIGGGTNVNGSGETVAYLQGLSKTTTAYVALERVTNGSAGSQYSVGNDGLANQPAGLAVGTMTAGGTSTLIAVGLNKKF